MSRTPLLFQLGQQYALRARERRAVLRGCARILLQGSTASAYGLTTSVESNAQEDDGNAASSQGRSAKADFPAAVFCQLLESIPAHPSPAILQHVRHRLEENGFGSLNALAGARTPHRRANAAKGDADAEAIRTYVSAVLQTSFDPQAPQAWAHSCVPELLTLLARLRIPSHPQLESALALLLRRKQLPSPSPDLWEELAPANGISRATTVRKRRGVLVEKSLPLPPPAPTAYRLAQAMASLPVRGHAAWQLLAERHVAPPAPLLDCLSPDQLTVLAAAFARAGYHPVEVFGCIAERLLPAVPRLQSGSLVRGLHAFARLRHHAPDLAPALCEEVHRRLCGTAGRGSRDGRGHGAASGGLLSLAGAALFGGAGAGPDRAHRVPSFQLEDLARLAEAAVALGAGQEAARRWGQGAAASGGSGGGGGGGGDLGDRLLQAVAEEAHEAAAEQVRRVLRTPAEGEDGVAGEPNMAAASASTTGADHDAPAPLAEQLEPVLALLGSLVAGAAGAEGSAAASVAHALAREGLAPALPALAPALPPRHLLPLLAALLPPRAGAAAAAALRGRPHPYPLPPRPQPPAPGTAGTDERLADDADGVIAEREQLLALVGALRRRADPRVASGAGQLLAAWHALAAARGAGPAEGGDPRPVLELMPAVCEAVRRHPGLCAAPGEAVRFLTSCALLGAFHCPTLDAVAAQLVAALGGGGGGGAGRKGSGARWQGSGGGGGSGARGLGAEDGEGRVRGGCGPALLAQLAWAVGQLCYNNEELLAAIQAQALALSSPVPDAAQRLLDGVLGAATTAPAGPRAGGGGGRPSGPGSGSGPGWAPQLGPLELGDVMWALAVNEFRSGEGAQLRELYLRASSQGVVHIDDPRWLQLARVHVLLLLGWAGGLGQEAAGALRSSWFNALGYAWERQAVRPGEHLAGPNGLPQDPDVRTHAFRHSVLGSARELLKGGGPGGSWRLEARYGWGMMRPSADIRLTVPLLARQDARRRGARGGGGQEAGGAGGGGAFAWQSQVQWQWVALDPVRRADEALTLPPREAAAEPGPAPSAGPAAAALDAEHAAWAEGEWLDWEEDEEQGGDAGSEPAQGYGQGPGAAPGAAHLLGPARWRHLVLRQLGVRVRPLRQEDWERATAAQRRTALLEALRG